MWKEETGNFPSVGHLKAHLTYLTDQLDTKNREVLEHAQEEQTLSNRLDKLTAERELFDQKEIAIKKEVEDTKILLKNSNKQTSLI